jgi:RsiW-degrading membrane proteinase PrsW (M82 family)
MAIDFSCTCGKSLHAPDGTQGRRARCPRCSTIVTVPAPAETNDEYDLAPQSSVTARPAAAAPPAPPPRMAPLQANPLASPVLSSYRAAPQPSSLRRFTYVLLILALIPLVLSTFFPPEDHSEELLLAIANHPELLERAENEGMTVSQFRSEVFNALPDHRVTGAFLTYESHAHWLIAGVAAMAFFAFLLLVFPRASKHAKGLLFAGLFTGTAGIILLLVFQFAAFHMPVIIPRGVVGLVLLIVKLIGWSYSMADNPDNGFLLSFIGYTCGVGLCEEFTKAIPLLLRIKPTAGEEDPSWNSLLLWGLASGIGFGIAEGIMYSGRYYNGLEGGGMYYTRFLSCVALHAMWAGAVGVSIYRHQGDLLNAADNWHYCFRVIRIIIVPMTLHGLYDTLLKKELDGWALAVALATFAWLAYQIERQHRTEPLPA